jgi:hypothetical protein
VCTQVLKDEKLGDNAINMGKRVRDGLRHMNAPIVEVHINTSVCYVFKMIIRQLSLPIHCFNTDKY